MKYYDWEMIKGVIADSMEDQLAEATVGIAEDWGATADMVWDVDGWNPRILRSIDGPYIWVVGTRGSRWGTPMLHLHYLDGRPSKYIECYLEERDFQ